MPTRPNILFIFTDQQALRAMSAYGNPHLSTPAMDSIAAAGVRFERCYCPAPVCGPARAAMMTGRMPHEVGINVNDQPFSESCRTLGHVFRDAGYETAYAGKWHLPDLYFWEPTDKHGFRFLTRPRPVMADRGANADPLAADAAIEFLRRPHDRPFLLVASLHNPHDICHDLFDDAIEPRSPADGPDLPPNFPRDPDEPQFVTDCRQRRHYGNEQNHTWYWTLDHWRGYLHRYYRRVEQADAQVGRIMRALRDQGLERDTLVVFTSDHGEGCAAHQWVVKLMLYEEPTTVPLIVSYPAGGIRAGSVDRTHLASGIDLLPTLCDYAGVPIPKQVSGVSLRPVIERPDLPADAARSFVVCELQPDPQDPSRLGRMLRTERYKYVVFSYGRNPEMLFDLDADPGETRNLAHLPEAAAILREHRDLLARWIAQTIDHFPIASVRAASNVRG